MMSTQRLIRIHTGSRLHFGLIDTAPPFGGLGVMIDQHPTTIELKPAALFDVRPQAIQTHLLERARDIAQRIAERNGDTQLPAVSIDILSHATPHCGFGSGTQFAMAIAEALRRWTGASMTNETLATQIAQRGKRSAVGVHGFFHGGLIYESADTNADPHVSMLNPIVQRLDLPPHWRVVIIHPRTTTQLIHDQRELEAFSQLQLGGPDQTESTHRQSLKRQIIDAILPAARAARFESFAQAIQDYNRESGWLFAAAQGGAYNGPFVHQMIARLQSMGIVGVGQSSWGPGVFAWCPDHESARQLADQITCVDLDVRVAQVLRHGFIANDSRRPPDE